MSDTIEGWTDADRGRIESPTRTEVVYRVRDGTGHYVCVEHQPDVYYAYIPLPVLAELLRRAGYEVREPEVKP